MFASVRVYESGELADYLSEHEGEIIELIGGISGFRSYHLIKTADGTISVSVFDSEDSAAESASVAAGWLSENPPSFQLTTPRIYSGEVVIDKA